MRRLVLAIALGALSAPSLAADALKAAPASLDPARGYVLVRLGERTPDVWNYLTLAPYDEAAEDIRGRGRAKANAVPKGADKQVTIGTRPFVAEEPHVRTYIVAVTPGRYVIAASPTTCFCLGSFSVDVAPGKVTDLGSIYIGAENGSSPWAALAKLHSSPDIETRGYTVADAIAIVPAKEDMAVPAPMAAFPRVIADYRPVRRFGNHSGLLVNRALPLGGQ
jgi:hypothetical protein